MRVLRLFVLPFLLASCDCMPSQHADSAKTFVYHLAKTVAIGGTGGWDYVKVDEKNHHVFVTHTNRVDVLDADSGESVGAIDDLHGVHGVALSSDMGKGYITNGKSDSVTIFDLKTLAILGNVQVGKKPDAIASDDLTHRVVALNGVSNSATVIDEKTGKVVGTIQLGAGPEFAVPDGKGHIFVNLEDTSETLMLDIRALKVVKRWKIAPGESPSSLAMNKHGHRLFIGCRNHTLIVLNTDSGKVVANLPVGDHIDATAYDPELHLIFSSNGDGTLTIVKQDDADHYRVVQTLNTPLGSRTMGLDKTTHRLYVPSAEFGAAPAPSKDNPKSRPPVIDGSFKVLVYEL